MTEISLNEQFKELVQLTLQEQQDNNQSAKSQNYFQDNNANEKKMQHKLHTTTKLKTRNYLSNIAYKGVVRK